MKRQSTAIIFVLMAATATLAHEGVQNPAVKARMDEMSAIADNLKILGQMAKGEAAFDAAAARSAAAAIATHAAATPALFEANETDPKTEALPAIWTNFDDFSAKALELEAIARSYATSINEASDLTAAMGDFAANCKACHQLYRE